jgi:hypothetical protein
LNPAQRKVMSFTPWAERVSMTSASQVSLTKMQMILCPLAAMAVSLGEGRGDKAESVATVVGFIECLSVVGFGVEKGDLEASLRIVPETPFSPGQNGIEAAVGFFVQAFQ